MIYNQLLKENPQKTCSRKQPLQYIRYAVGEIVLVVIGILVALQINNWNIERINRLEEKEYLNRIMLNVFIYNDNSLNRITESLISQIKMELDNSK